MSLCCRMQSRGWMRRSKVAQGVLHDHCRLEGFTVFGGRNVACQLQHVVHEALKACAFAADSAQRSVECTGFGITDGRLIFYDENLGRGSTFIHRQITTVQTTPTTCMDAVRVPPSSLSERTLRSPGVPRRKAVAGSTQPQDDRHQPIPSRCQRHRHE